MRPPSPEVALPPGANPSQVELEARLPCGFHPPFLSLPLRIHGRYEYLKVRVTVTYSSQAPGETLCIQHLVNPLNHMGIKIFSLPHQVTSVKIKIIKKICSYFVAVYTIKSFGLFFLRFVLICLGRCSKISQAGWLKQQSLCFHSPECWKSKITAPAGWVCSETSAGLADVAFYSVLIWSSLFVVSEPLLLIRSYGIRAHAHDLILS